MATSGEEDAVGGGKGARKPPPAPVTGRRGRAVETATKEGGLAGKAVDDFLADLSSSDQVEAPQTTSKPHASTEPSSRSGEVNAEMIEILRSFRSELATMRTEVAELRRKFEGTERRTEEHMLMMLGHKAGQRDAMKR
jgi:hypothetical protein